MAAVNLVPSPGVLYRHYFTGKQVEYVIELEYFY